MEFTMEQLKGLDALAAAIVRRAIDDYKLAYMAYLKTGQESELNELRNFFHGQWCRSLISIDPALIIEKIEQDCKARFERKKNHGKSQRKD